jgi:hypothetical protein
LSVQAGPGWAGVAAVGLVGKRGVGMKFRDLLVFVMVLVLLPTLAFGQTKKKKKTVPAVFGNARYVYVQAEDGDVFDPNLVPEDRQAIADVEAAIRDWNRYTLTARPEEAELIFFVRKGRLVTGKLGGTVGTRNTYPGQPRGTSTGGMSRGAMVGADVGPPDDLLEVRAQNQQSGQGGLIWQRTQTDGLNAPRVPLLQDLRDAVERDYPQ